MIVAPGNRSGLYGLSPALRIAQPPLFSEFGEIEDLKGEYLVADFA